jgi:hypothetical protein
MTTVTSKTAPSIIKREPKSNSNATCKTISVEGNLQESRHPKPLKIITEVDGMIRK